MGSQIALKPTESYHPSLEVHHSVRGPPLVTSEELLGGSDAFGKNSGAGDLPHDLKYRILPKARSLHILPPATRAGTREETTKRP
jgi:hypothetical protein